MRGIIAIVVSVVVLFCGGLFYLSWPKVPYGNVGVKVYLLGGSKGVSTEVHKPGRVWVGMNQDLYLFPTFTQNYVWTKDAREGSPTDESVTFQTNDGLVVGADIGISYRIDEKAVPAIFQKYRRGVEEITDTFLRNMVRDALVSAASKKPIEAVYGSGKVELLKEAETAVKAAVPEGIVIEKLYYIGDLRLPASVTKAIDAKIAATQLAQQRENEIRSAKAEAEKEVAAAQGKARAITEVALAQAKANKILSESITPELVRYKSIEKWDGVLPRFTGGSGVVPIMDVAATEKQ